MSKMNRHLLRQKVRFRISVMKTNTANSPETKSVFVFITEIIWRTLWCNKWRSVFDVVKNLRLSAANPRILTLHRTIIHIFSIPWLGWAEVTNFHTMFCWTFWCDLLWKFCSNTMTRALKRGDHKVRKFSGLFPECMSLHSNKANKNSKRKFYNFLDNHEDKIHIRVYCKLLVW